MAIRKVGIIGGGPAGVAAAKALSLEPSKFDEIHLFEKKPQLGGLWNYSEDYKAVQCIGTWKPISQSGL